MYSFSTVLKSAACAAVLVASIAANAGAQLPDRRTLFTFSGPVALPGVTLPAGQYLFRLADPATSGRVVQVLSEDGRTPYGLFFTTAAERLEPAPAPEVRFMETAAGMPTAIKTWWYPGERRGYELVYPKEQARRLAQGAGEPVLTTQAATTTTGQTNTADLVRISSTGEETSVQVDAAPAAAMPGGTSQQGEIAPSSIPITTPAIPAVESSSAADAPAGSPVSSAAPPTTVARTSLPQTATRQPLLTLLGAVTFMTGAGLWMRPSGGARV